MIEKFAMSASEIAEVKSAVLEAMISNGMSYEEIAERITLMLQAVCEEMDIAVSAEQAAHAAKLAKINKSLMFWFILSMIGMVGIYVLISHIDKLEKENRKLKEDSVIIDN